MSLRGFHIIFITFTTLLCAGFAVWALYLYDSPREITIDIIGWVCAAGVLLFPAYGIYFYRKAKHILI